jgi:hypothetical protein
MKYGNWIPISKAFVKHLPKDRPFTKLEAMYSMQCDYDNVKTVTIAGYAECWQWSRNKVRNFLNECGVDIFYPENTLKRQNQKGQIEVQIMDRSGTEKGQIRFIDSKCLGEGKDRKRTDDGQIMDRSKDTTRYPNPNPDKKSKKTSFPKGFIMDEKMIEYAHEKGIHENLDGVFEDFTLYHKKKGSEFVDWGAAWQTWVRKHLEFHPVARPIEKTDLEELRSND